LGPNRRVGAEAGWWENGWVAVLVARCPGSRALRMAICGRIRLVRVRMAAAVHAAYRMSAVGVLTRRNVLFEMAVRLPVLALVV